MGTFAHHGHDTKRIAAIRCRCRRRDSSRVSGLLQLSSDLQSFADRDIINDENILLMILIFLLG